MPQVDLSGLSTPELRGLLDAARRRGQAAQSYQILQEMEARRRPSGAPPQSRPRVVTLDLGDPLERREEVFEAAVPDEAPLYLGEPEDRPPPPVDTGAGDWDLVLDEDKPKPKRNRLPAIFAAGLVLGGGLGFALANEVLSRPDAPATAVFPAAPMLPAAALPKPAPAPVPPPPEPPVELTAEVAPPPAEPMEAAEAPPEPDPLAKASAAVEEAAAEVPAVNPACARAPTPADRTICADPELKRLQADLRHAYAEAMDAHADRGLLRQRQLAWRDARSSVEDRQRLAHLYEARIRKLHAAAAEARAAR